MNKVSVVSALALAFASAPAMAANATPEGSKIEIPSPPPGKGQIVFFRPSAMGFALGCSVNENGQKVSSLGNGKYFVMVTEPGEHQFSVKTEAKDVLTLLVEPDETQFAKCRMKMGIMAGRPDIAPSTAEEFVEKSDKLKPVDDDDMGPGAGALRSEELAGAIAAGSREVATDESATGAEPEAELADAGELADDAVSAEADGAADEASPPEESKAGDAPEGSPE